MIMKPGKHLVAIAFVVLSAFGGNKVCAQQTYTIVDLNTGTPIDVYYDTEKYITINRVNHQPVDYYIVNNVDTVMGTTGLVVNGMLIRTPEGKYRLDENKVRISGDELEVVNPQGKYFYWTPQGWQMETYSYDMPQPMTQPQGQVKQKGNEKEGKMKSQWGTIKWKKGGTHWKFEPKKS